MLLQNGIWMLIRHAAIYHAAITRYTNLTVQIHENKNEP